MRVQISNCFDIDWYSYFYLFMVVLYSAQPGGLNGFVNYNNVSLIVFIIPPILTFFILKKNYVNFLDKRFLLVLLILSIWFVVQYIYRKGAINLTLTLFHYYQLALCFIVVQVFRDKLFWIYEDIVYKLAVLSLILWSFSIVAPYTLAGIMHLFQNGNTISEGSAYVYTMMRIDRVAGLFIRNAGFAWEPGRYACFLCLAIFCNFMIRGFEIRKNKHLIVFIIALITTQSTTGIFTLILLMLTFMFNKKFEHRLLWGLFIIPIAIYMTTFDFALEKAQKSLDNSEDVMELSDVEGHSSYALDRFESFVIEWNNFIHEPVMGYCEQRHSYFDQNVAQGFITNNGTMKILGKYGLLGLLYYFCIYISSKRISQRFRDKFQFSYLLLFIFIGMGYNFENIVLIMSFSFWGLFVPKYALINLNC